MYRYAGRHAWGELTNVVVAAVVVRAARIRAPQARHSARQHRASERFIAPGSPFPARSPVLRGLTLELPELAADTRRDHRVLTDEAKQGHREGALGAQVAVDVVRRHHRLQLLAVGDLGNRDFSVDRK